MPIHHGDTVRVTSGKYKDEPPSKVVKVHRKQYRLYIDNVQREKANGAMVKVPVAYSNCVITKLKLDPSRQKLLRKKVRKKLKGRKAMGLVPFPTKESKKKKEEAEGKESNGTRSIPDQGKQWDSFHS